MGLVYIYYTYIFIAIIITIYHSEDIIVWPYRAIATKKSFIVSNKVLSVIKAVL